MLELLIPFHPNQSSRQDRQTDLPTCHSPHSPFVSSSKWVFSCFPGHSPHPLQGMKLLCCLNTCWSLLFCYRYSHKLIHCLWSTSHLCVFRGWEEKGRRHQKKAGTRAWVWIWSLKLHQTEVKPSTGSCRADAATEEAQLGTSGQSIRTWHDNSVGARAKPSTW